MRRCDQEAMRLAGAMHAVEEGKVAAARAQFLVLDAARSDLDAELARGPPAPGGEVACGWAQL